MNYILFDGPFRNQLLPLTYTRPVSEIRVGILTIREKWEKYLSTTTTTITEDYLSDKYPMVELEENILINSSYLPNRELVALILNLKDNQAIFDNDHQIIAFYTKAYQENIDFDTFQAIDYREQSIKIKNTWDIFSNNGKAISQDFELLTKDKISQAIPSSNHVINIENIFVEQGASMEFVTLNANNGPIYIGANAEIMEGSIIRGPLALCEQATIKLGTKIYGPTTVGPFCKVGGEINNSVFFGYSNKGHDGFLGNSVIGEWCNLGADTNCSNLKNNYAEVRLWNYEQERFSKTGLQFCGLIMGDHSKCGINTMFNTGTVVGVNANIFGSGFPRNFIPSYSWGGSSGFTTYLTDKAFEVAEVVMKRREVNFTAQDKAILEFVFEMTKRYRNE